MIGRPSSPPSRSGGHERDLAEQRHPELAGELGAAAGAEELVADAVVAGEPAHVLDHAPHGQLHLARRAGGALGHTLGCRLRAW